MTVENIWYGKGLTATIVRLALAPFSALFSCVVALRRVLYDRKIAKVYKSDVFTVSVGNITVGGTGKTPVTAYLVENLVAKGLNTAVVMRGYGDDEPLVHRHLNPSAQVITDPDRVAGIKKAKDDGAQVVVLDDAFQHRRAERHFDIVLISAEQWKAAGPAHWVLPAGPYREMPSSLRRASAIVITQKRASDSDVMRVEAELKEIVGRKKIGRKQKSDNGEIPIYRAKLEIINLVAVGSAAAIKPVEADRNPPDQSHIGSHAITKMMLGDLAGKKVLAVSGIGDPESFIQQLKAVGADVSAATFPDHHKYTPNDVAKILEKGRGFDLIVTTLKDAVKLKGQWAANNPRLWYVSQAVKLIPSNGLIEAVTSNIFTLGEP